MEIKMSLKTPECKANPAKFMEKVKELAVLGWKFEGAGGGTTDLGTVHTATMSIKY